MYFKGYIYLPPFETKHQFIINGGDVRVDTKQLDHYEPKHQRLDNALTELEKALKDFVGNK